jgi:SAM-dependent methyltransferase
LENESFDVVSMVHVTEHLFHPVQVLRLAHGLLRDGGLLFLEVPNSSQPLPALRRYFRPKHNFYFTANTVRALAGKAGFTPLRVGYSSRDGSVQLLCVKGTSTQADPRWYDDARSVMARVHRERNRIYLILRLFITNYLRLQWMKGRMLRRYGHLLPEIEQYKKAKKVELKQV